MSLVSTVKVLTKRDMQRIHEATIKILEETGVVFHHDEALEIFKKHGAKVNGNIVCLPKKMVEEAMVQCPSQFKWLARDKDKSVVVGGDRFLIFPNGGPVNIQDIENGRRPGTMQDFINLKKIVHASKEVDILGFSDVDPSDFPNRDKYLHMLYQLIKNSDKPIQSIYAPTPELTLQQLEMVEMSYGKEGIMEDNVVTGVSINPLTPLGYDFQITDTIIKFAQRKQMITYATAGMCGLTTPVSILGLVTVQNAEVLAGMVLAQLVNPGTPVIYAPCQSVSNLKNATYVLGVPETMLSVISTVQMAEEFYKIPARCMGAINDSKVPDAQAGYESMQNLLLAAFSGASGIYETYGILDSLMTVSYEKTIMDLEAIGRVRRILEGVDNSDEAIALDIIQEVGIGGSFLTHPTTFAKFRDRWDPTVSDYWTYEQWVEQGSESILERANRKYKEIIANAPDSVIDSQLDNDLMALIKKAFPNT